MKRVEKVHKLFWAEVQILSSRPENGNGSLLLYRGAFSSCMTFASSVSTISGWFSLQQPGSVIQTMPTQVKTSLTVLMLAILISGCAPSKKMTLGDAWNVLKEKKFVDLTHDFAPGIPHWKGFPDEHVETLYWYEPGVGKLGSGFYAQSFTHTGQWGTHVDPPAHFARGMRTVDQINVKEMILPLVVIDVHEAVAKSPDYTITMEDVKDWEKKHGRIPEGAFVAMRTDWSKLWPDMEAMQNKDAKGIAHYPGWSMNVLKYLYEDRKITASGHETTDTDPGIATSREDYSLEAYILKSDHYQIELLAHLDEVPEAGALVVAAFPKPKDGSGFPARVFAILP